MICSSDTNPPPLHGFLFRADFTKHVFSCLRVMGGCGFHLGSDPQRLMDAAEIVVHEMERHFIPEAETLPAERLSMRGRVWA